MSSQHCASGACMDQEAALGSDHPDVVAIRDVLMTEDAA